VFEVIVFAEAMLGLKASITCRRLDDLHLGPNAGPLGNCIGFMIGNGIFWGVAASVTDSLACSNGPTASTTEAFGPDGAAAVLAASVA